MIRFTIITYIFAHATPEVVAFLVYALCGGKIPLPLTVMQILAVDLGTDTLPALMQRPPRQRHQSLIEASMLARAWGRIGGVWATLVMVLFLVSLRRGGWHLGADVSAGRCTMSGNRPRR